MIRKAMEKDLDVILTLFREQFACAAALQPESFLAGGQDRAFLESVLEDNKADILVLEDKGAVQGFVLLQEKATPDFPFFVRHRYAYLMDIIIIKKGRGKGWGRHLMTAAKEWAKDRNLDYVELDVLSNNEAALNFYNKQGFQEKRRLMRFPLDQ